MDDDPVSALAGCLENSVAVSVTNPLDSKLPFSRIAQYKTRGTVMGQEKRRAELLEEQKRRRQEAVCLARQIALGDADEDTHASAGKSHGCSKARFKDRLMFSEWMADVPSDLAENWLMVPCPIGKRNLVVASSGKTRAYTKAGHVIEEFISTLPGGSSKSAKEYTVLDCIYSEAEFCFYVLDIMCWAAHPVYDSDTEFRFFWIQSKLAEVPSLSKVSDCNRYPFLSLPTCVCTKEAMAKLMLDVDFKTGLDGLLFYHRQLHYVAGATPLVGWLKPFMLPEILEVSVPEKYLQGLAHKAARDFITEYNAEAEKKLHKKRHTKKTDNDTTTTNCENIEMT